MRIIIFPLISVIVPIYKVERYLKRCIDSITNQTYKNLEIILVDDESPDNCGKMCDEYSAQDDRIKVIHQKNKGLSGARNSGLKIATGDYIAFVDSDDFLHKEAFEIMYSAISSKNADIVQIADTEFYTEEDIVRVKSNSSLNIDNHIFREYDSALPFLIDINQRKKGCAVWGKLYRKKVLDGMFFEQGILNEDYLFLSKLLMGKTIRMVLIDDYYGYYYFIRENSISHSGVGKSVIDAVNNTVTLKRKAEKDCVELVPYIGAYSAYQSAIVIIGVGRGHPLYTEDLINYCVKNIKKNKRYLHLISGSWKVKLFCYCVLFLPKCALTSLSVFRNQSK